MQKRLIRDLAEHLVLCRTISSFLVCIAQFSKVAFSLRLRIGLSAKCIKQSSLKLTQKLKQPDCSTAREIMAKNMSQVSLNTFLPYIGKPEIEIPQKLSIDLLYLENGMYNIKILIRRVRQIVSE